VFKTLYRYPHPFDPTRFIYVGQGAKRDQEHRSGKSSFGRRFKRDFPNIELPQPIREEMEAQNQFDLNELETIWMFQYHTWRPAWPGGYNIIIPGSQDYKSIGIMGGKINAASGQTAAMGKIQGRKNADSGQITRMHELPQSKEAYHNSGKKMGDLCAKNNIGVCNPSVQEVAAPLGGCATRDKGVGIFAPGMKSKAAHISGTNHRKNGTGVFAPGVAAKGGHEAGKIVGPMMADQKRGVCAPGMAKKGACSLWNIKRNKPCVCGMHN
jgi:hypothetical protein